jgi:hypothetical protein
VQPPLGCVTRSTQSRPGMTQLWASRRQRTGDVLLGARLQRRAPRLRARVRCRKRLCDGLLLSVGELGVSGTKRVADARKQAQLRVKSTLSRRCCWQDAMQCGIRAAQCGTCAPWQQLAERCNAAIVRPDA